MLHILEEFNWFNSINFFEHLTSIIYTLYVVAGDMNARVGKKLDSIKIIDNYCTSVSVKGKAVVDYVRYCSITNYEILWLF